MRRNPKILKRVGNKNQKQYVMKTKIYFGFLALLFVLGCSNEELVDNPTQDNLLSRNNGNKSIRFDGNSTSSDIYYYYLTELNDETDAMSLERAKFIRDGQFSGHITGCGKIISSSSTYKFSAPQGFTNPNYNPTDSYNEFTHNYNISATGKISVGRSDSCDITITGVLEPYYYASPEYTDVNIFGGLIGDGIATITNGTGRLKNMNGTYLVQRSGFNFSGINLTTGQISLWIGQSIIP